MADDIDLPPPDDGQEHPAARRMRERFEAHYGDLSDVMRACRAWRAKWSDFQRPYNLEMSEPVFESDVDVAECRMLEAVNRLAAERVAAAVAEAREADTALLNWLERWHSGVIRLDDTAGLVPQYLHWGAWRNGPGSFRAVVRAAMQAERGETKA